MSVRWTPRRLWVVLLLAVLATGYAWAGAVMNADFTVAAATEGEAAGHRLAVYVFVAIALLSIAVAVSALAALWRARQPSRPAT